MYTQFTDVINGIKGFSKSFSNFELVKKKLRSLPKSWDPKIMAIQKVKDLEQLSTRRTFWIFDDLQNDLQCS